MSDMGDMYRDLREYKRTLRAKFGVPCPRCKAEQPRRQPTILQPGDRCRVHRPAYVDPRPELTQADITEALSPATTNTPASSQSSAISQPPVSAAEGAAGNKVSR